VSWYEPRPDFPYVRGIVPIVISWFLSPLLAALITLVFFLIIRTAVLRRQNSTKIAFWVLPFLIFFTIFVSLLFVLVSGSGCIKWIRLPDAVMLALMRACTVCSWSTRHLGGNMLR
jgi:sodium-dependent phosphate transporter